jgi:hypothetical protein
VICHLQNNRKTGDRTTLNVVSLPLKSHCLLRLLFLLLLLLLLRLLHLLRLQLLLLRLLLAEPFHQRLSPRQRRRSSQPHLLRHVQMRLLLRDELCRQHLVQLRG